MGKYTFEDLNEEEPGLGDLIEEELEVADNEPDQIQAVRVRIREALEDLDLELSEVINEDGESLDTLLPLESEDEQERILASRIKTDEIDFDENEQIVLQAEVEIGNF